MRVPASQKSRAVVVAAGVAAGVALGWLAGTSPERGEAPGEDGVQKAKGLGRMVPASLSRPAEEARREVDRIRAAGSPEARQRATIELVSGLTTEQLGEWLRHGWFDFRGGFELSLFQQLAMERWRREDPLAFAAWRRESSSGEAAAAAAEWIGEDRERLRKYFDENPDERYQLAVLGALAESRPELAVESFLEVMARHRRNSQSLHLFRSFFDKLAESAPEHLEGLLGSLTSAERKEAEGAFWVQRLRDSEEEGLRALMERPNGFALLRENAYHVRGLGNRLLSELENLPESWRADFAKSAGSFMGSFMSGSDGLAWFEADYEARGFTAEEANNIRRSALHYLVQSDPAAVLGRLEEVEMDDEMRSEMLTMAFQRVNSNAEKYQELLALLPSEDDRETVRSRAPLALPVGEDEAAFLATVDGWLERLSAGEMNSNNDHHFRGTLQSWRDVEFATAAERFRSLQGEERDRVAEGLIDNIASRSRGAAATLRGEAIRHQVEQFVASGAAGGEGWVEGNKESAMIELSSAHVVYLGLEDPEAARAWVQTLPEGEVRRRAQRNLAATWADYDPDAVARWLGTLPAERRADVEGFMESPDR